MIKEIKKLIKGEKDCEKCNGTGFYKLLETQIVCNLCNAENIISAYYQSIDAYVASKIK